MSETTSVAAEAPLQSPAPVIEPTQRSEGGAEQSQNKAPGDPGNLMAEAKAETPEAPAEPKAPEAETPAEPITYDFKLPEGVANDDPLVVAFTEAVAEAKLPADAAQAVMAALAPKVAEALQAPYRLWSETQTKWQDEVRNDPEIGGTKLQPTLASIAKMLDDPRFCDPGLRDALTATGAGNHPLMLRSFAKIAAALTEGGMVAGTKPAAEVKSTAAILYPNMAT